MKKQVFNIFFLICSLVLTSALVTVTSCTDDDDDNGGGETSLTVTAIDPLTARVGETVTLTGSGFSTNKTLNAVQFTATDGSSRVNAVVNEATATQLIVVVPEGAGDGAITVAVGEKTATSPQSFTLDTSLGAPELSSIAPTNGYVGTAVTITGANFGEDASVVKVYFNEVEVPEITSITNTTIETKVPVGLEVGDVPVKVVRNEVESSNTLTFTVDKTPTSVKTVYWTSSDGIYKGVINENGADISQLYTATTGDEPQGIEVDTEAGQIYWGTASGKILKAPISGEGSVETLYDGLGYICDIAINETKLFILGSTNDWSYDWIRSANLSGSGTIETLYSFDQNSLETGVWNVKLEVSESSLYWTEEFSQRVMTGSVNGSSATEATVLFDADDGLTDPVGIALDNENNKIYIVDKGSGSGTATGKVWSGNLTGGDLSTFIEPGDNVNNPNDAEIDLDNGYFFWLNNSGYENTGEIMRANLDGTQVEKLFDGIDFGLFFDLDIH